MNRNLLATAFFACIASVTSADSIQSAGSKIVFEREPSYLGEGCIFEIKVDNVHIGYLKPRNNLVATLEKDGNHNIKISYIAHSECGGDYINMDFVGHSPALYSVTIGTHSSIVVGELDAP